MCPILISDSGKLGVCLPTNTCNSIIMKSRVSYINGIGLETNYQQFRLNMESLNILLRTIKALAWLAFLALSAIIVVPWCALQSLLVSLRKDREIPQNEKRTVLLTGGPLTKGNSFLVLKRNRGHVNFPKKICYHFCIFRF